MTKTNEIAGQEVVDQGTASGFEFISLEDVLGKGDSELFALNQGVITASKLGKLPVTQLSNAEYKQIKKDHTSFEKLGKRMIPKVNEDKMYVDCIIAAVDKDDRSNFTFKKKDVLERLGVISAAQAVEALLLPGEIVNAAITIQEISGFTDDAEEEMRQDVKNS